VYIRQVQRIRFRPLLSVQYAARDVHRAPPSSGDGGDGVRTEILAGDDVVAADSAVAAANSASVDPVKALPAQGVQKPALWAGEKRFSGLLVAAPREVAEKVELPVGR